MSNDPQVIDAVEAFSFDIPASFPAVVEISRVGDLPPQRLPVVFRYRTREELNALDQVLKDKTDAEAIEELVLDWTVPGKPFNRENVQEFVSKFCRGPVEILQAYHREHWTAKAKN